MNSYTVVHYNPDYYKTWNEFVSQAKNATFLFHRNFMEYHSNRFQDFSLLVLDAKNKLQAVLPANRVENKVFSHQGLTYGGLLFSSKIKTVAVFSILDAILAYLKQEKVESLLIKELPSLYATVNSDEVNYYLYQKGGKVVRKDMNLAYPLAMDTLLSKSKLKHYNKIDKSQFKIREENNFEDFWNLVLIPRLAEKHQAKPVHTLEEIEYLANKFPENIKQFNVYYEDAIVAGITTFETEMVVKSQYGATTNLGQNLRALDFLYFELFKKYKDLGKQFFDMGVVTDASFSQNFNPGLLQQKEELGGVVYSQDYWELKLD